MDTPQAVQASPDAPGAIATPASGIPRVCTAPLRGRPGECGRLLTPKQQRWCSRTCGAAHHDSLHPRINPPGLGLRSKGSIKERIRQHLLGLEGRHATTLEIAAAIQERESTTARELRKLRKRGCPIQTGYPHGHKAPSVFWLGRA